MHIVMTGSGQMMDQGRSGADLRMFFRHLYEEHYKALCWYAVRYTRDMPAAEDIVHEVFVAFWEKRSTIDREGAVKAYLYRSVANRSLNWLRDRKQTINPEFAELASGVTEDDFYTDQAELEARVHEAIAKLPPRCGEVFRLSRFEDLKYREIAERLNISVRTVEVQMSKALQILREELKEWLVLFLILLRIW